MNRYRRLLLKYRELVQQQEKLKGGFHSNVRKITRVQQQLKKMESSVGCYYRPTGNYQKSL